jgi:hypothetical protein
MELYKAKDGAKSKPLSKFPKNLWFLFAIVL